MFKKKGITTASAKAKGRRLQQEVRDMLYKYFPQLEEGDVKSTSMGAGGEDIQLSPAARKVFPYMVECKKTQRLNLWSAYEQCTKHAEGKKEVVPIVIFKKNGKRPLVAVDFEWFVKLNGWVRHD